ncbi:glycosyl transferase, group 1/2 family protein [Francisella cf. novicida Fx1]|uniref:glycosyltransferase n=1 Tax=Francisella tularensis TaxID=263 RepID=UPI00020BCE59|nr:glycosyltransferase [Francisella tularensis]AEE87846.1 glycosyl transferase, group 1/2 family protein [Francisella cf. novicida Fx1]
MQTILHLTNFVQRKNLTFPYYILHKKMSENGINSFVLALDGDIDDPNVYYINKQRKIMFPYMGVSRYIRKIFFEKILGSKIEAYFYPEWNTDFVSSKKIAKILGNKVFDTIIVHQKTFAFTYKVIYELNRLYHAKVIIIPYDMAPYTGGCAFSFGCDRYKVGCGYCPLLGAKKENDLSRKSYKHKQKYLNLINDVKIVVASQQIEKEAKQSLLFNSLPIYKQFFPVDSKIFRPLDNISSIRERLGIEKNDFVIFFGAADINNERKGFKYLIDVLNVVSKYLDKNVKISLIVAGQMSQNINLPSSFKLIKLGYISTQERLNEAFNASDIFINPSIEDSGPMMVNISLMTGTPVIAFNIGVAPDLIVNVVNGYIVRNKDIKGMAEAITRFCNNKLLVRQMSINAREKALIELSSDSYLEFLKNL